MINFMQRLIKHQDRILKKVPRECRSVKKVGERVDGVDGSDSCTTSGEYLQCEAVVARR
ncbi:hypothetical protein DPMN_009997 [Dreissena polymorpha]|uniref:Uncharacterized protein n=1 Tax=Dreissena polymorpha TaxID=45954 RepID=A0A9D4MXZ8_DREPO|nr:hypothetical protein DPMN_009997 [Dreissena polymorpha]